MMRLHIGGLGHTVSEKDIRDRFGKFGAVSDVEIITRKDEQGTPLKTFAYININISDSEFKRCKSVLNKSKWKGGTLQIELAKESFLHRLAEERQQAVKKAQTPKSDPQEKIVEAFKAAGVENFHMKAAVPGTEVPGHKNWVVSKFGRVLPVLHLKCQGKNKVFKYDPSKHCHNIKKLDSDQGFTSVSKLTWEMNGGYDEISKKRRGEFPPQKKCLKKAKTDLLISAIPCGISKETAGKNRTLTQTRADLSAKGKQKPLEKKPLWVFDNDDSEDEIRMLVAQEISHNHKTATTEVDDNDENNLEVVGDDFVVKSNMFWCGENDVTTQLALKSSKNDEEYDSADTDEILTQNKNPGKKEDAIKSDAVHENSLTKFSKGKAKKVKKKTVGETPEFGGTGFENSDKSVKSVMGNCDGLDLFQTNSESCVINANEALDVEESVDLLNEPQAGLSELSKSSSTSETKPSRVPSKKSGNNPEDILAFLFGPDVEKEQKTKPTVKSALPAFIGTKDLFGSNSEPSGSCLKRPADRIDCELREEPKRLKEDFKTSQEKSARQLSKASHQEDSSACDPEQCTLEENVDNSDETSSESLDSEYEAMMGNCQRLNLSLADLESLLNDAEETSDDEEASEEEEASDDEEPADDGEAKDNEEPSDEDEEPSDDDEETLDEEEEEEETSDDESEDSESEPQAGSSKLPESLSTSKTKSPKNPSTKPNNPEDIVACLFRPDLEKKEEEKATEKSSLPAFIGTKNLFGFTSELSSLCPKTQSDCKAERLKEGFKTPPKKEVIEDTSETSSDPQQSTHSNIVKNSTQDSSSSSEYSASSAADDDTTEESINDKTLSQDSVPEVNVSSGSCTNITSAPKTSSVHTKPSHESALATTDADSSSNTSSEDSETSDDEEDTTAAALNVTSSKQSASLSKPLQKSVSDPVKQQQDNQKRLAALEERQKETEKQKKLIQGALSKLDCPNANKGKHIVFDSDDDDDDDDKENTTPQKKSLFEENSESEEEEEATKEKENKQTAGSKLFDSSEDEDDDDDDDEEDRFQIKPQFEGKAGQKLMELQSRFGADPRFQMDAKFLEDDQAEEQDAGTQVAEEQELVEEKQKNLAILQSVLNVSIQPSDTSKEAIKAKTFRDISALHYDPTSEAHAAFETKTESPKKESKAARRKKREEAQKLPEVSKEIYYDVAVDLKEVFGASKESQNEKEKLSWDQEDDEKEVEEEEVKEETHVFSFLSGEETGKDTSSGFKFSFLEDNATTEKSSKTEEYKIETLKGAKVSWQTDPRFQDSSSEDDDDDDDVEDEEEKKDQSVSTSSTTEVSAPKKAFFFFHDCDIRLKEGPRLFCRRQRLEEQKEAWEERRAELRQEYKKRHKDAKKRQKAENS